MNVAVEFKNVDIIFGEDRGALAMATRARRRAENPGADRRRARRAGANLTVNEGEISVLMGLSGSGKSTLLRAVNGLNKVTRGQVIVKDGDKMVDVANPATRATLRHIRQKQVAMVFQQFALLPWRTVERECRLRPGACRRAGQPNARRASPSS
jgi:glycine betaine/proline transport system ATP-binding protein